MAKNHIVQRGHPALHRRAKEISQKEIGNKKLHTLIQKMKRLLAAEKNGVGLAAPQIGESVRIFVVSHKAFEKESDEKEKQSGQKNDLVFINPKLVRTSRKKQTFYEGCLSVRGTFGNVTRPLKASVSALDEKGRSFIYHGSGLIAEIFQHELDHLDGHLFIEKAENLEEIKEDEENT